jgi:uncharacterized membrane protein
MLLSHHAPCDLDRTIGIGPVRLCTRCVGVFFGIIIGAATSNHVGVNSVFTWLALLILPLPAALDFSLHELSEKYRGNNRRRFATGVLLGLPLGWAMLWLSHGFLVVAIGFVGYLMLIEITIAGFFCARGHLDEYVERYANAVHVDPQEKKQLT